MVRNGTILAHTHTHTHTHLRSLLIIACARNLTFFSQLSYTPLSIFLYYYRAISCSNIFRCDTIARLLLRLWVMCCNLHPKRYRSYSITKNLAPMLHTLAPMVHKLAPMAHKFAPMAHRLEPMLHKFAPMAYIPEPMTQKHEPTPHKLEPTPHTLAPMVHTLAPMTQTRIYMPILNLIIHCFYLKIKNYHE